MNFTHLKPKSPEDIQSSLETLTNYQVYLLWLRHYSSYPPNISMQSLAYEELKRRHTSDSALKPFIREIESSFWFSQYRNNIKNELHSSQTKVS